ncbi:MAG: hypothetical protein GF334_11255 [Candidatus Altiarchaeales archaeon]|nr:hypothetical protein [Candidatus Altiarchaeales archaeon]
MEWKCAKCSMQGVCRDSLTSWIFFAVGVIATISMRIIEPLRNLNPLYAKAAWYVGVSGFFLFFIYKYRELKHRSEKINETGLREKLKADENLGGEDKRLLLEIICSQDNRKERINFFIIFALSALALAFALFLDLT